MKTTSFNINTNNSNIPIHIGEPNKDSSPLEFQAKYFAKHYNINLPPEILECFASLNEVAKALKIPLPVLIDYTLNKITEKNNRQKMAKNQQEIAKNISQNPHIFSQPKNNNQANNEK